MSKRQVQQKKGPKRRPPSKVAAQFGPVSSVNTAPVAIGNSIRGTAARTTQVRDGIRVIGRDFCFTAGSTVAAVTGWELIGGFPVTPAALPSSILRNYCQMYGKFKINGAVVHYITSSATSQTGDVLFYYERDRKGPAPDHSNNSFLPYILSDSNTVLGPQWMNHSLMLEPTDGFNNTDYGMTTDLNEDTCGSIFLYSKTSAANSPGYIIWDYDITFKELVVNPRAGILPIARAQWWLSSVGKTSYAATAGSTTFAGGVQGNSVSGTAGALPTSASNGDIYKIVCQVTASTQANSAWTNIAASNMIEYHTHFSQATALTIDDGFTMYGALSGSTLYFYPTLENAMTDTMPFYYGVTATVTFNMCIAMSYVTSIAANTQASY